MPRPSATTSPAIGSIMMIFSQFVAAECVCRHQPKKHQSETHEYDIEHCLDPLAGRFSRC
jgi:hypothetical protein